jgi:hypothetical protein
MENQTVENETLEAIRPKASLLTKIASLNRTTKIVVVAAIATVLSGGTAFAYASLQSPNTLVGLALASAFTSKHPSGNITGTLSSSNGTAAGSLDYYTSDVGTALKLSLDGTLTSTHVGATLNLVTAKNGDSYINLEKFDGLGNSLFHGGALTSTMVNTYAKALTGTWIKLPWADASKYANNIPCIGDELKDPTYTSTVDSQVLTALRENNFIVVTKELASTDGDRAFELGVDAKKFNAFLAALEKSPFYVAIQSCTVGSKASKAKISAFSQSKIDAAIAQAGLSVTVYAKGGWNPKLDKLVLKAGNLGNQHFVMTVTPAGDQSSKVVIPRNSESLEQLVASLIQP